MLGLSSTLAFQACCTGTALFEILSVFRLLNGELFLHDLGGWVDNTREYNANKPLQYVFIAMLACLVAARTMACMLPKSRMVVAYSMIVHALELAWYVYCCQHKATAPTSDAYTLGGLMTVNLCIFIGRSVQLRHWQKTGAVADRKWRQEQLAIIRQKRAEYAQRKETKKKD